VYDYAMPVALAVAMHNPATRWDLYAPTHRSNYFVPAPAAGGFQPAWAIGSNSVIGAGATH